MRGDVRRMIQFRNTLTPLQRKIFFVRVWAQVYKKYLQWVGLGLLVLLMILLLLSHSVQTVFIIGVVVGMLLVIAYVLYG